MKLLAYTIDNQKYGIDILTYDPAELNGNKMFITIENNAAIPENYTDISSIENWFKYYSESNSIKHHEIIKISDSIGYENLTNDEQTIVNSFGPYLMLTSHLLDMNVKTNNPEIVDYDILGLFKKQTFVKGDLILVEYFLNYNEVTNVYSGLAIKEERTYYRVDTRLRKREMTISWYMSDGTVAFSKFNTKFYSVLDSGQYGIDRRRNIIEEIKIIVVYLIMVTEQTDRQGAENLGMPMLAEINDYINYYINNASNAVIDVIIGMNNYSFLNNVIGAAGTSGGYITIRDYVIDALYIDYEKIYTLADKSPFSL